MSYIEVRNLTKKYKTGEEEISILNDLNLHVEKGEFVSIVGPSGAGKSTFLTILGGLTRPTNGEIIIDGIHLYRLSQEKLADFRRTHIGFVFQSFYLIPYLTVIENVMLPLAVSKLSSSSKKKRAQKLLERVGLKGKEKRLPDELSGGEQQRVAIARALINSPSLLLADEPTGNLDSKTGKEIIELFRNLNEDGHTVIMVTHNLEYERISKRIVRMNDGRIEGESIAGSTR